MIYIYICTYLHIIIYIYAFSICLHLCMLFMPMYKYIAWYSMNHACIFSICWASPLCLLLPWWCGWRWRLWPPQGCRWLSTSTRSDAGDGSSPWRTMNIDEAKTCKTGNGEFPTSTFRLHAQHQCLNSFSFAQFWASKERFWTCSLKELWKAAPSWTWSWRLRNHEPTKLDENRGKDDTWGMDMIKNHQKPLAFWAADFWCCHTCNLVAQLGRKMMKDEGQEINLIQFG